MTKKLYRKPIYGGDGEEIGYYLMMGSWLKNTTTKMMLKIRRY